MQNVGIASNSRDTFQYTTENHLTVVVAAEYAGNGQEQGIVRLQQS